MLAYQQAIRAAWTEAGMVRLLGAVPREDVIARYDRLAGIDFTARVSPLGLVWIAPEAEIAEEIARFWSEVLGVSVTADAEIVRFRKGSWSEAVVLEETRWMLDLTPSSWNEADGGFVRVDGSTLAMVPGALDIFGPGRVIEVPLVVAHRDRVLVSGALR
jgi:hypothetical protein